MDKTTKQHLIIDVHTPCRVCLGGNANPYVTADQRAYWSCPDCAAICLDKAQLPNVKEEHERYLLHNNDPADPRYRNFVNRLAEPLLKKLKPGMKGLDYGCGPGPALGLMLCERGYDITFYDPFFAPSDDSVLTKRYDFILCSEVVEHFHQPAYEFAKFNGMLNSGGWLGIMTSLVTNEIQFESWHYRRDPTHVVFYHEKTFQYLASHFGWSCEIPAKNIVLMQKDGTNDVHD